MSNVETEPSDERIDSSRIENGKTVVDVSSSMPCVVVAVQGRRRPFPEALPPSARFNYLAEANATAAAMVPGLMDRPRLSDAR